MRRRCFLDIKIANEPSRRIVVELFDDKTPITCEKYASMTAASSSR